MTWRWFQETRTGTRATNVSRLPACCVPAAGRPSSPPLPPAPLHPSPEAPAARSLPRSLALPLSFLPLPPAPLRPSPAAPAALSLPRALALPLSLPPPPAPLPPALPPSTVPHTASLVTPAMTLVWQRGAAGRSHPPASPPPARPPRRLPPAAAKQPRYSISSAPSGSSASTFVATAAMSAASQHWLASTSRRTPRSGHDSMSAHTNEAQA
eukprot:188813-Chlamydomonas_euryale.AAC.2